MEVIGLPISGVLLITPRRFADERGYVSETYNARDLESWLGNTAFVQDNHSLSRAAGTIRGLHFQAPPQAQGKLVRVIRGRAYDVAVDIRHGSPTFGHHVGMELSAENRAQLWIPPGLAHGFCTLEDDTEVLYKLTAHFSLAHERGIAWNDPELGIAWPIAGTKPIISQKDLSQPRIVDLPTYFTFRVSDIDRSTSQGQYSGDHR